MSKRKIATAAAGEGKAKVPKYTTSIITYLTSKVGELSTQIAESERELGLVPRPGAANSSNVSASTLNCIPLEPRVIIESCRPTLPQSATVLPFPALPEIVIPTFPSSTGGVERSPVGQSGLQQPTYVTEDCIAALLEKLFTDRLESALVQIASDINETLKDCVKNLMAKCDRINDALISRAPPSLPVAVQVSAPKGGGQPITRLASPPIVNIDNPVHKKGIVDKGIYIPSMEVARQVISPANQRSHQEAVAKRVPPVNLPPEATPFVAILVNVPKLKEGEVEQHDTLLRHVKKWCNANCTGESNIADNILSSRRVNWVGTSKKKALGDCVIVNFKSRNVACRLFWDDSHLDTVSKGVRAMPLGFFYPRAHSLRGVENNTTYPFEKSWAEDKFISSAVTNDWVTKPTKGIGLPNAERSFPTNDLLLSNRFAALTDSMDTV
ncbi:uncharacterized protein LOC144756507 [Lissotriton helveticus]